MFRLHASQTYVYSTNKLLLKKNRKDFRICLMSNLLLSFSDGNKNIFKALFLNKKIAIHVEMKRKWKRKAFESIPFPFIKKIKVLQSDS